MAGRLWVIVLAGDDGIPAARSVAPVLQIAQRADGGLGARSRESLPRRDLDEDVLQHESCGLAVVPRTADAGRRGTPAGPAPPFFSCPKVR
jgi:hypothetical protein